MHIVQTLFYQYRRCNNNGENGCGEMSCISCCASHLTKTKRTAPQHQYFGARVNVLKLFLLVWTVDLRRCSLKTTKYLISIQSVMKFLNSNLSKQTFEKSLDWLTDTYVDALNIITTWLISTTTKLFKWPSCQLTNALTWIRYRGFASFVDTLSAIKYATVKPIRERRWLHLRLQTIGEYPR